MKIRPPIIRAWTGGEPVAVDLFAGGGGASEGKRRATGRSPDVAVNHWPPAIAMHKVNHPDCRHFLEDVYKVKPIEATKGCGCSFLWASPTCSFFSRAKGARLSPGTIKIRGLAWSIMPWIIQTRPDVILLENVIEFLQWGPVCWQHIDTCRGDKSGTTCIKACRYGRPIKSRAGSTFRAFKRRVESYGYSFEVRILNAWEYGAPTTRPRAYVAMRADGQPFAWPEPTHVRPEHVESTGLQPWRTAAEIIDWSIQCPSIFQRKKPHVPATRRRLARGMRKFVLEAAQPFLMHLTHGDRHAPHSIDVPVPTVTGANRGEQSVVVPYMIHRSNGERPGQEPRVYDVLAPHPVVVAGGLKTSPVVAFLAKAYSERRKGEVMASDLAKPLGTVTAQDHHHLVAAHTVKFYGTSTGHGVAEPLATVTGGGWKHGVVAASLLRYNGQSIGQHPASPIGTIDATDRYALAEYVATEWNDDIAAKARRVYQFLVDEGVDGPWMDHANRLVRLPGTDLVIYDIGMRMLIARELFRANGFSDDYVIDIIGANGKPITKTEQVRMAGNVVCPDVAAALVRAGLSGPGKLRRGEQLSMELEAA